MTNAEARFNKSHIRKVYACLAVTCHLHFWQNDRDVTQWCCALFDFYSDTLSVPLDLTTILVFFVDWGYQGEELLIVKGRYGWAVVICGAAYPFSYSNHHPCGATRFNGPYRFYH